MKNKEGQSNPDQNMEDYLEQADSAPIETSTDENSEDAPIEDGIGKEGNPIVQDIRNDPEIAKSYEIADEHQLSASDSPENLLSDLIQGDQEFDYQSFALEQISEQETDLTRIKHFISGAEGDKIALGDLLEGVNDSQDAQELSRYLNFSTDGENTLIEVSKDGSGLTIDHTILLEGIQFNGTDSDIIQQLLDDGSLTLDPS